MTKNQQLYLRHLRNRNIFIQASRVMVLFLFLISWEYTSAVGIIDSFVFCSPSKIYFCFIRMLQDHSLYLHVTTTLYETLMSFILVTLLSILVAVLLWTSDLCARIFEPFLVTLNSLPKSALAPLLIVWLGANRKTIIVAGISVAIFGSILSIYTAFSSTDFSKQMLIKTLGGNRFHILTKVVLPSNLPVIISNMKINIGLCLVGVVIGEFIGGRQGLGYLIIYGSQVFKMDWMLTSMMLLCIISFVLYFTITMLEKKIKKRSV